MIGWILFVFAVGFVMPFLIHAKKKKSNDLLAKKFKIENFSDSDINRRY